MFMIMAMALLKIFGTKDYYFTTHATKRLLKMYVFFYLKAEKAENLSACLSDLYN